MSLPLLGGGSGHGSGGGGGGGGAWDPSQLPLQAWYKFDTLSGSNGDPQSSLTDASGNGFTLSQTSTNRATLAAADQNSRNTLRFTSSSTQFYPIPNGVLGALTAGSMYIVYKGIGADTNGICSAGSSAFESHYPFTDGHFYLDFGSTIRKDCGIASTAVTAYRSLSIYSAAGDWALYVDGGTGGSSGGTSALFQTGTNSVGWRASGQLNLGAGTGTVSPVIPFNGWIAELFFTSAKQSTSDRQKAEGYLAWKWGLTGNLDSTHPYKSVAP